MCAYHCAQLSYTIQNRTVLIISLLISRQSSSLGCCLFIYLFTEYAWISNKTYTNNKKSSKNLKTIILEGKGCQIAKINSVLYRKLVKASSAFDRPRRCSGLWYIFMTHCNLHIADGGNERPIRLHSFVRSRTIRPTTWFYNVSRWRQSARWRRARSRVATPADLKTARRAGPGTWPRVNTVERLARSFIQFRLNICRTWCHRWCLKGCSRYPATTPRRIVV